MEVNIINMLRELLVTSGFASLSPQHVIMLIVSMILIYLAIVREFEPLLLLPIAFGMLLANLPDAGLMYDAQLAAHAELDMALDTAFATGNGMDFLIAQYNLAKTPWYESGVLRIIYSGVKSSIFPCLIFMGVGAMTDFGPLLSRPSSLFMGAAAQLGIYVAFSIAMSIPGMFTPQEAASIAIIGGADGPTAIFLTSKLAPHLLGPIAIAAYSYMALIPIIQPPIMKALTTQAEREIKMEQSRVVSKTEKIIFPIAVTIIVSLMLPSVAPLMGMFMLGNLFQESGVVGRLSDTAQNALMNIVTIMLGISVGATANGEIFLQAKTLGIVALGLVAFSFSTAGGVLIGKLMCKLTKGKINPLIGSAGVSAVPMAARVSHNEGRKYNPTNYLLMHAMGPNVAGVIGSAVAAGFLLIMFQ